MTTNTRLERWFTDDARPPVWVSSQVDQADQPTSSQIDQAVGLASHYHRACALYDDNKLAQAIELFQLIVKNGTSSKDESLPTFQYGLAQAYYANGQLPQAIELYEHAVENGTNSNDKSLPIFQYGLARAYDANNQLPQAVELYEHAVAGGKILWASNNPERQALEKSLARAYEANNQHAKAAEMHQDLARAYKADGQKKKVISALGSAMTIMKKYLKGRHPDLVKVQCELGQAYRANGEDEKAIKFLENVTRVSKEPDLLNTAQRELNEAYTAAGHLLPDIETSVSRVEKVLELFEEKFRTTNSGSEQRDDWSMKNNS